MNRPAAVAAIANTLTLLLLLPVAHGSWSADAPGRCIRTLRAYGPAKSSSVQLTRTTRPGLALPSPASSPARTKIVLDDDGDEGLGEAQPASEPLRAAPAIARPPLPRARPSSPPTIPLRC